MKKKFLALSVALALGGVAGTANASFSVTEGGTGHVLITPFYTVQSGQHTYLNIVNTDTANGKAVKVRFRAALDSDDAFDFQVFLSPGDVWNADVQPLANGGVGLYTDDKTCTLPQNVGKDWTGNTPGLSSKFVTDPAAGARTWSKDTIGLVEGYVEIFNMGDIPRVLLSDGTATQNAKVQSGASAVGGAPLTVVNPLFDTIKHAADGSAPKCDQTTLLGIETAQSTALFTSNGWTTYTYLTGDSKDTNGNIRLGYLAPGQRGVQLSAPTDTLFGNWIILNTADQSAYSAGMTSVASNYNLPQAGVSLAPNTDIHNVTCFAGNTCGTRIVYSAQSPDRVLNATDVVTTDATGYTLGNFPGINGTADAVLLQGNSDILANAWNVLTVRTAKYDFPDMSTPYELNDVTPYQHVADLSNALLRTSTVGEFLTYKGADVVTGTDWVFSQPTRRYHVAGRGAKYIWGAETVSVATFTGFRGATAPYNTLTGKIPMTTYHTDGHAACVLAGAFDWRNREEVETAVSSTAVISPSLPTSNKLYLCNEVGVVGINPLVTSKTDVLASPQTSVAIYNGLTAGAAVVQPVLLNAAYKDKGWARLTLNADSNGGIGLPLLGQQYSKFVAGNPSAGYGYNYNHRFATGQMDTATAKSTLLVNSASLVNSGSGVLTLAAPKK